MKKLLLVVDMINGFITTGNLHDPQIARIVPACEARIQEYLAAGNPVVAFCDSHNPDSQEFASYPLHCLAGSEESRLVEPLAAYEQQMTVILKNSTNGFWAPGFADIKANLADYQEIMIVGCCSDICVLQLALALKTYCNQNDLPVNITVDSKACDTFELPSHSRESYNKLAFDLCRAGGVQVL